MAVLLALASTLSIGIGEFLADGVTKRTRANEVTATMFVGGVAFMAVVAVVWPGSPSTRDLIIGSIAGATNGAAILLLYIAYSRGALRSAAPAAAVVMSAVPVAWDLIVEATSPSATITAGLALGVVSIGFTSYERGESVGGRGSVAIAMAAGVTFGVLLILLDQIGDDAGGTPLLLQRIFGLAVAAAVTRATGPRILPADRRDALTSFAIGIFASAAVVLIVLAFQRGDLGIVSVVSSQYAGVAVLLAFVFRGQRLWWWQALGLVGAGASVALISIG